MDSRRVALNKIKRFFWNKKKTVPETPWYLEGEIPAADCVGAYVAKGASSYASSLVNLVTPGTLDLLDTAPQKPTWNTSTGWGFNGSNNYLAINKTVPPQQRYSYIIRYGSYVSYLFGFVEWGTGVAGQAYFDNMKGYGYCSNGDPIEQFLFPSDMTAGGVLAVTNKVFKDGVEISSGVVFNNTVPNVESRIISVGGENNSSGATTGYGDILAFSFYNRLLTDAETIAVSQAMMAL